MEEWKARLIEAEKVFGGKIVKLPPDIEFLRHKQELADNLLVTYTDLLETFFDESPFKYQARFEGFKANLRDKIEGFRKIKVDPENPHTARTASESLSSEKYQPRFIEAFESLLKIYYNHEKEIATKPFQDRLHFLSIYFNFIVPFCGFILPRVDGRLSYILGHFETLTISLYISLLAEGKKKDRITDGKKSLEENREKWKRAVLSEYLNLRRNPENKKLRKKVVFVEKIEKEMNGPGYLAKFKKPPSQRSIVRLLDELTAEGRIHPPWKRSQT